MEGNGAGERCSKCEREIDSDYYLCDICSSKIHPTCAQLSSSEVRCMPIQKRTLIYACNGCKDVLKKIPSFINLMEEVGKQLSTVAEMNKAQMSLTLPPMKCAEVAKKKKVEEVVVIKPKDKTQDSSKTKKVIEEKINPIALGAEVSRIKYVREGGVAISCTNKEDLKNISENIEKKLNKEYKINIPEKKNPRLKVINIEKKLIGDLEKLIDSIVIQNNIDTNEDTKIVKILSAYEDKKRKTGTIILEVDHNTYKLINKKEVLYIGWRRCRYFEHVNVVQCYKCWKFGHMAQQCTGANIVCPKCSENHKQDECKSETNICVNCRYASDVLKIPHVDYQHTAYDRKCEAYKKIFEQLQMRVNYPDTYDNPNK